MLCLCDGKLPEYLLITVDDSILTENGRLPEHTGLFKLDGFCVNLEAPILGYLHLLEHLCHIKDLAEPFRRTYFCPHESIAHVWTFADAVRDVCQEAAFGWEVNDFPISL